MAKTFRFTDEEEQKLNETALRVNRELVKLGEKPLRDTEIFHEIIRQTLLEGNVEVSREGKLRINSLKKGD